VSNTGSEIAEELLVKSIVGRGTIFTINLPRTPEETA